MKIQFKNTNLIIVWTKKKIKMDKEKIKMKKIASKGEKVKNL